MLHLLAIANEARVDLDLDDFNRVAARVPHLADTKPHGKYHMTDLDRIGGVPVVMAELLDAGLLHGDCLTVTGQTVAENLAALDPPAPDGDVVHPMNDPIHAQGGIAVLPARSPPREPWSRWRASDQLSFDGPARVFDGEDQAMEAILAGDIEPNTVVVIRYEGPKGGPGMREMLAVTGAMKGVGRGARLRPGHRRPVLRRDPRVLHRPRGARGRRRGTHRPGRRRRPHRGGRGQPHHRPGGGRTPSSTGGGRELKHPAPRYTSGVLAKFARLVTGAERGAITEA